MGLKLQIPNQNHFGRAILALMGIYFLSACQPHGFEPYAQSRPNSTGFTEPVRGVPYVASGDPRVETRRLQQSEKIQKEGPSEAELERLQFSSSITSFEAKRTSKNQKMNRFGEAAIEVKISLKDKVNKTDQPELVQLAFKMKLKKSARFFRFEGEQKIKNQVYKIKGEIEDSLEHDLTEGSFTLIRPTQKGQDLEAQILTRSYIGDVDIRQAESSQLKALNQSSFAWVTTSSVVSGRSFYRVQMFRLKSKALPQVDDFFDKLAELSKNRPPDLNEMEGGLPELPQNKIDKDDFTELFDSISSVPEKEREGDFLELLAEFSGENLPTGNYTLPEEKSQGGYKAKVKKDGALRPNSVIRIGDGEELGETAYALETKLPSGKKESAFVVVRDASKKGKALRKKRNQEREARYQIYKNLKNPKGSSFFDWEARGDFRVQATQLRQHIRHKEVSDLLSYWTGKSQKTPPGEGLTPDSIRQTFLNFLPLRELTQTIYKAYSALPHLSLVSTFESRYLRSSNYVIEAGSHKETAIGPFQINRATAIDRNLKINRDIGFGQLDPSRKDERMYFAPSACAAARIVQYSRKIYPEDIALSVLSHNQGPFYFSKDSQETELDCNRWPSDDRLGRRQKCLKSVSRSQKYRQGMKLTYTMVRDLKIAKKEAIKYTDRAIALMLLALDSQVYDYQFPQAAEAQEKRPKNVFPKEKISSKKCEEVTKKFRRLEV